MPDRTIHVTEANAAESLNRLERLVSSRAQWLLVQQRANVTPGRTALPVWHVVIDDCHTVFNAERVDDDAIPRWAQVACRARRTGIHFHVSARNASLEAFGGGVQLRALLTTAPHRVTLPGDVVLGSGA